MSYKLALVRFSHIFEQIELKAFNQDNTGQS